MARPTVSHQQGSRQSKTATPSASRLAMEQRILRGAEQVFAEYGFRGASMDRIANHIGISK